MNMVGLGPAFLLPSGIAVQDDGSLVVVDAGLKAVVRVDPTTGNRMIISKRIDTGMVGSGPAFMNPNGIAVQDDGSLVVVDAGLKAVVRVDKYGDRMIISKRIDTGNEMGMGMVGGGPAFVRPSGIAVEDDGSLVVVDSGLAAVVRVNKYGDRMIISNNVDDMGSWPAFMNPNGIAVQDDGSLVVVDAGLKAVVRVDPTTGNRMIISNDSTGMGPDFVFPSGIAVEDDGSLVVVDTVLDAVVRVNKYGDRKIISKDSTGMGPDFVLPRGIAVETW